MSFMSSASSRVMALTRTMGRRSLQQQSTQTQLLASSMHHLSLGTPIRSASAARLQPHNLIPMHTKSLRLFSSQDPPSGDGSGSGDGGANDTPEKRTGRPAPAAQHVEWVDFQKSIAVAGFDTGQLTEARSSATKQRGGRQKRSKRDAAILERMEKHRQLKGGEYPADRYSPEETQRLLQEAYDTLPKRMGKRGSRALKRQKLRFKLVRRIRAKYKANMAAFQIRKMQKRSDKIKGVLQQLKTSPDEVKRDKAYQFKVYQRYREQVLMNGPEYKNIEEAQVIEK